MNLFNTDTEARVFRDRDALQNNFIPDELAGSTRDDEMQQLAATLQPIIYGDAPDNVILRGPNGSGKTAAVRIVLNLLEHKIEQLEDRHFSFVVINGSQHSTGYQLTRELANALHGPGEYKQGHSYSALLDAVAEGINDCRGAVIVAIDELSDVENIDKLLYLLTRSSSNDLLDGKQLGILAATTDTAFKNDLSSHVKSTLGQRMITFDAYTTEELRSILAHRIDQAFANETVDESALSLCAALARQQGGDARFALDLLKYAGDIASQKDITHVTNEEVEAAREMWEKEHITSIIADCTVKECQVIYAIIELVEIDDLSGPRTAEIIQRYETVANRSKSAEIIGDRMVARYLESFVEQGLLRTSLHHHSNGTWREYDLDLNLTHVLSALHNEFSHTKIEMHDDLSQ